MSVCHLVFRLNMTEKLFTGTLIKNQNKNKSHLVCIHKKKIRAKKKINQTLPFGLKTTVLARLR